MTTMSSPASAAWCCRNDSLTMRLILFLDVAARQCFFEMARPSRAVSVLLSMHSTVNHLSRLRVAFLKTRPNAAASNSRLLLRNRYGPLPGDCKCLSAVVTTAFGAIELGYGVSLARPLARRRLRTRRPAFVAMRARKPCVRARLILLG